MHAEHGLGMHVFVAAQRSAPTNMLNNAVCVNSIHKLRFAQDLALYNLDLSEAEIGFDGEVHRDVWQNDPVWQGVRENVERLTAIGDWAEAVFATNVVYESLVGVLFRSHLVMQIAARNGDYVTPDSGRCRRERLRPRPELHQVAVLDAGQGRTSTARRTRP